MGILLSVRQIVGWGVIAILAFESASPIRRGLGRRRTSKGLKWAIFARSFSVPQFDIQTMGVLSLILKQVSSPNEFALRKRPRSIRDGFGGCLPEEWPQDGDASADETCVDLDDAPEESLGPDPQTICSGEASHQVGETDDGDDPVSDKIKYKNQPADKYHTILKGQGGRRLTIHRANYENDRDAQLVSWRQLQSPNHRQRQDEYQQIGYKVQGTIAIVGLERQDAMAREIRYPVFSDGPAAENLRPEIAEEIAERDEHNSPGAISKGSIHVKDPQVQAQNRHLVAEQTRQVDARGDKDPLQVLFCEIAGDVPGVEAYAVAGRDTEEDAVGDAEG